jgi:outer membrane protein assembly factor BamB
MYHGCCSPFIYANDLLFKSTYGTLMCLDPRTGRPLWTHRNGGNKCARPIAARSILFMPTITGLMGASRMGWGSVCFQAFVWEKLAGKAPAGDALETGPAKLGAGSPGAGPGDWPAFARDARNSGSSPAAVKLPLKLLWKSETRGRIEGSPAVAGGVVYVGSRDHKLYALDAATGAVKWVFFADGEIRSSPCVAGGGVYFGCDDGRVYALEAATGRLAWSYRTATRAPRSPFFTAAHDPRGAAKLIEKLKAGDKEMLDRYCPYRSCTPLAFNGQPLPSPGAVRSSPVVADGVLYVGTGLGSAAEPCWGYAYALDALTGRLLWKVTDGDITDHRSELAIGVAGAPCVAGGRVHFSYGTHTTVDAGTGRLLLKGGTVPEGHKFRGWWDRLPPDYRRHDGRTMRYWVDPLSRACSGVRGGVSVAADGKLVLVTCRQLCRADKVEVVVGKKKREVAPGPVRVYAVDAESGEIRWEGWGDREGVQLFEQPAALHGGKVYAAGGQGIAVFDLAKGSEKVIPTVLQNEIRPKPWSKRIVEPERTLTGAGGFLNTAPAIAGGLIFAGSDDGRVYAWKLDGEQPVWHHQTGGRVRSSPALAGGRLYVGSDDGSIYCFGSE